jgi:hypothetical protein
VLGFSVTVNTQATKFTAQHADTRIEVFLEKFLEENLRQEQVAETIAALSKLKVRWSKIYTELHKTPNTHCICVRYEFFCRCFSVPLPLMWIRILNLSDLELTLLTSVSDPYSLIPYPDSDSVF